MERDSLAREIIHTCLEMTRLGLNQGTAVNVSVRDHDGMLITPTGIPYENLTEYAFANARTAPDAFKSVVAEKIDGLLE